MTTKNKDHKELTVEKVRVVKCTIDQLQHPESSNILLDSIQGDFIAQSGTLSTVTRTTTGVILGTVWAICYKEQEIEIPNIWLLLSLVVSILFLVVELLHYLFDSIFYHNKSDEIVEGGENIDYNKIYKEVQKHSKCSFRFLKAKAYIVIALCVVFVIGIIQLIPNICWIMK